MPRGVAADGPAGAVSAAGIVHVLMLIMVVRRGEVLAAAMLAPLPPLQPHAGAVRGTEPVRQCRAGLECSASAWLDLETFPVQHLYGLPA